MQSNSREEVKDYVDDYIEDRLVWHIIQSKHKNLFGLVMEQNYFNKYSILQGGGQNLQKCVAIDTATW